MTLKRTPLKKGKSQLKHSPLKSGGKIKVNGHNTLRPKPKTEEEKREQQEQYERDVRFYMEIWDSMELPRRCFETGKLLPSEPLLTLFHHCLYKSSFPQYRYEKWNIVVILPDIHSLTHSDIDKTPKIKEYTKQIKEKYLMHYDNK